ncbi:MAG: TetR/AcrR family transcriptional regulator [Bacteroidia bacterium]|nr:TetR/AcrR family transcriptional regulator [Bacteroidia bacterium]MDW8088144.1 TetR/AcrR family transcriptional regulator [Bacteroidia bacterium]
MDTAARIREAAIREFLRYGYDGARLERIAKAAGVHTAQIHYYFRSKRGLYEAVQGSLQPPGLEEVLAPLQEEGKPLPERVQAFYERFYERVAALEIALDGWPALPPLLRSPAPLAVPLWVEALQNAQRMGLLRPWPVQLILVHQWGLALAPLWFQEPRTKWESYYRVEAPRLFWEGVRAV